MSGNKKTYLKYDRKTATLHSRALAAVDAGDYQAAQYIFDRAENRLDGLSQQKPGLEVQLARIVLDRAELDWREHVEDATRSDHTARVLILEGVKYAASLLSETAKSGMCVELDKHEISMTREVAAEKLAKLCIEQSGGDEASKLLLQDAQQQMDALRNGIDNSQS